MFLSFGMDGSSGNLLYEAEAFRIRGAAFEVSRVMGHGFLEAVYQECLALEFTARSIPFRPMPRLQLEYIRGQFLAASPHLGVALLRLVHEPGEPLEQVQRIRGAGGGFGVVLDREDGAVF